MHIPTIIKSFIFLLLSCGTILLSAQQVSVSKEFNLRNDYSYELLGNIDGNIIMFRDRGNDFEVELLEQDLTFKRTQEIKFEKRNVNILGVIPQDTSFTIYYGFKDDGKRYVRARTYNNQIELVDSNQIHVDNSRTFRSPFTFLSSPDNSKVLLYGKHDSDAINLIAVDQDSLTVIYDDLVVYEEFNFSADFKDIHITNQAEVVVLFEKNNRRNRKDKHYAEISFISPETSEVKTIKMELSGILSSDIALSFDEYNRNILVAGLYHEKNKISSSGYFFLKSSIPDIVGVHKINFIPYTKSLLTEVNGKLNSKETELQHYKINNISYRRDGGFMLVTEMQKELSRRTYYNGYNRRSDVHNNLWKDYYNENIIMFSFHPEGKMHWNKVLHKKQFSQDDDNVYSSYFMFKTPSRLRLLYNDEIKKDNTVSEYVIDPVGDHERNSVMSTDYQNLRLRFKDAIQLSKDEILVPSEKSLTLNLVKIKYE